MDTHGYEQNIDGISRLARYRRRAKTSIHGDGGGRPQRGKPNRCCFVLSLPLLPFSGRRAKSTQNRRTPSRRATPGAASRAKVDGQIPRLEQRACVVVGVYCDCYCDWNPLAPGTREQMLWSACALYALRFQYLHLSEPDRNVLVGAVVGGPDQSDGYTDSRDNYAPS
jgi:hypothetical protein